MAYAHYPRAGRIRRSRLRWSKARVGDQEWRVTPLHDMRRIGQLGRTGETKGMVDSRHKTDGKQQPVACFSTGCVGKCKFHAMPLDLQPGIQFREAFLRNAISVHALLILAIMSVFCVPFLLEFSVRVASEFHIPQSHSGGEG